MSFADPVRDYLERTNIESPVQAGFSMDGGSCTGPWIWKPADGAVMPDALHDAIREVLGGCEPDGVGGLNRTLPKACPIYPWLVADRIQNIAGFGAATLVDVVDPEEFECPVLVDAFAAYEGYLFTVNFLQKPYALVGDENIEKKTFTWYDTSGASHADGAAWNEWTRFTDYTIEPAPEYAHAQHGQMEFRTVSGAQPGGTPGWTFSGFPRITVPTCVIRFNWRQIPFSFVDSSASRLVSQVGMVNQLAWYGFQPGELLYLGCQITKRYLDPVPEPELWADTTVYSPRRNVDVEMRFLYTKRTGLDAPSIGGMSIYNANWIPAGHNLPPCLGRAGETGPPTVAPVRRGFYYATNAGTDPAGQIPLYESYPFQLLFRDPDA